MHLGAGSQPDLRDSALLLVAVLPYLILISDSVPVMLSGISMLPTLLIQITLAADNGISGDARVGDAKLR